MQPIDENVLFKKVSWRILPILMLAFFLSYLDRANVGFAKLQMSADLNFSDAVYGFGAGIFFIGYFLLEIPSNLILHRVGARTWISRIMFTWGFLSCAVVLVRTPYEFYAVRFLLGLAEAGFIPGAIYYMSQWYPEHRRGRAWGTFYIALAASGVGGGLLSSFFLGTMSGVAGLAGWQWMMLGEGLPTVLLSIYMFLRMDDDIAGASWLTDPEKRYLQNMLSAQDSAKESEGVMAALTSGKIWVMVGIYFGFTMGLYAISFWMPTLIQRMGVADPVRIGLLSALPGVCAILSLIAFGYSADKHNERKWHLITCYVMAAVGFVLCALWQYNPVLGIVALCIANIGVFSMPALFWSVPTSMLTGITAAAGIALINCIGNLAGFVSPYMIGYLSTVTGRTDIALLVVAGVTAFGAVLVYLLMRSSRPGPLAAA